jgi:hypothetical protein
MRRVALTGAATVLLLGLIGVVSIAAAPQAAEPSTAKSKTLSFDVVFSPFSYIPVNPTRNPDSPFALGRRDHLSRPAVLQGQAGR